MNLYLYIQAHDAWEGKGEGYLYGSEKNESDDEDKVSIEYREYVVYV